MAKIEIILPALGEGIIEAEITRWLVGEGEQVSAEQPLVEIATDKVDSEVASPRAGILQKILVREGETPKIGQVLAILEGDPASIGPVTPKPEAAGETDVINGTAPAPGKTAGPFTRSTGTTHPVPPPYGPVHVPEDEPFPPPPDPAHVHFFSPAVKTLIRTHRLSDRDISMIRGTGSSGRITLPDVKQFLESRQKEDDGIADQGVVYPTVPSAGESPKEATGPVKDQAPLFRGENGDPGPPISREELYGGRENEVIEMDRMRKLIARHMSWSKKVSPHVNSFMETDVTRMLIWRDGIREKFREKYGQKLTVTPVVIHAVAAALREYPRVNISVDGERIILKKNINIGMATVLPDGNLIVPVIRDAGNLSLPSLAARVNDLAERARNNKLKPDEIQGGTFTVTNLGAFGSLSGTPIINQPEVAILALGTIKKKPAVVETPRGDAIGIRHLMILCLAYDHRVIDGALGGSFLKCISDMLEQKIPSVDF